ncbi:hypothetical protein IV203_004276 [Nitzschia inconspicua]|uniref:Uncharacterized protein n=1 Tax=Nitzschia inconspicua TaxID=303405 RepID=A0A9K3L3G0_9STRA|nr:hypothetical protein IV203_004276 [Nitzschia inconspicua]
MNKSTTTSNTEPRSSDTGEVDEPSNSGFQDSMDVQRLNLENDYDRAAAEVNNASHTSPSMTKENVQDSQSSILESWFELEDDGDTGQLSSTASSHTTPTTHTPLLGSRMHPSGSK